MKLAVHERIGILNLLPQSANYVGLQALRKAREIISFNAEEKEFYKIVEGENGSVKWDGEAASQMVADLPIEQYIVEIIREKLAKMNEEEKLTNNYLSLYEKFIINYRAVE